MLLATLDHRVYLYLLRVETPETADEICDAFFLSSEEDVWDAISLLVARKVIRSAYDHKIKKSVYFVNQ